MINRGQKYKCIKETNNPRFVLGNVYISHMDGALVNEFGDGHEYVSEPFTSEYFELTEEEVTSVLNKAKEKFETEEEINACVIGYNLAKLQYFN